MPKKSLRVVARIKARPDSVGELRSLLLELIEPTRNEPGCISYELLQNKSDPTDFTFVEEWDDDASLDAHLTSDHLQHAVSRMPDYVVSDPEIRRYRVVG